MIKTRNSTSKINGVNDCSILPKIRQILLHWNYDIVYDDNI